MDIMLKCCEAWDDVEKGGCRGDTSYFICFVFTTLNQLSLMSILIRVVLCLFFRGIGK